MSVYKREEMECLDIFEAGGQGERVRVELIAGQMEKHKIPPFYTYVYKHTGDVVA